MVHALTSKFCCCASGGAHCDNFTASYTSTCRSSRWVVRIASLARRGRQYDPETSQFPSTQRFWALARAWQSPQVFVCDDRLLPRVPQLRNLCWYFENFVVVLGS